MDHSCVTQLEELNVLVCLHVRMRHVYGPNAEAL